jgi:enoyl-CoA hydratase/carnithine racemase
MKSEPFSISQEKHYSVITLSRPEEGNRLLTDEIRALGQVILTLGRKRETKLVVVKAGGEAFCLGRQPAAGKQAPKSALAIRDQVTQPILDLYANVRATPVPVLAVVQGEARGFGCALVGQCDLAIAADTAKFSLPELETNLPPTLAISAVLGKVPPKRLLHLVYSSRSVTAGEALELGLLSEVAAAAALEDAAKLTVSDLISRNRQALCAVKEYMEVAPYVDTSAAARLASNILAVSLSSHGEE